MLMFHSRHKHVCDRFGCSSLHACLGSFCSHRFFAPGLVAASVGCTRGSQQTLPSASLPTSPMMTAKKRSTPNQTQELEAMSLPTMSNLFSSSGMTATGTCWLMICLLLASSRQCSKQGTTDIDYSYKIRVISLQTCSLGL